MFKFPLESLQTVDFAPRLVIPPAVFPSNHWASRMGSLNPHTECGISGNMLPYELAVSVFWRAEFTTSPETSDRSQITLGHMIKDFVLEGPEPAGNDVSGESGDDEREEPRRKKRRTTKDFGDEVPLPKPHACCFVGCDASFSKPKDLKRHEESVHLGYCYVCPRCKSVLGRADQLKRHITNSSEGCSQFMIEDLRARGASIGTLEEISPTNHIKLYYKSDATETRQKDSTDP
ncbi:hypothetical protein EVJ58_g2570 [Rhodofomes roseus]|uniref:C2H2-type domain-containing protein n=1 Tax=Rhodofomes roseus TaxID=34475 RepID=A0A4Y9YS35_9APHY|nr:hypothetical protein EVJ58_g2570 [Rhodofomes roseus]